jgi:hypothetical protein
MAISTTMTSREFNQGTSRAKKATAKGPVFVTDRGEATHVLITFEEYQRLTRTRKNILERLAMPKGEVLPNIDFETSSINMLPDEARIEQLLEDMTGNRSSIQVKELKHAG